MNVRTRCLRIAAAAALVIAWFGFGWLSAAQAATPAAANEGTSASSVGMPPFVLKRDGQHKLDQYVERFVDPTGKLTIETVSSAAYRDKFTIPKNHTAFHGSVTGNVWLRVTIKDTLAHAQSVYLESGYPIINSLEFYQPDGRGRFTITKTGAYQSYNDRPYRANTYIVELKIKPGETQTYYIKAASLNSVYTPLRLYTEAALTEHLRNVQFALGMYFGAMGAMLLFNLFVFFVVRIRSYVYYCIYIAGLILQGMVLDGVWFQVAPSYNWPHMFYMITAFGTLITIGMLLFTRHFLNLKQHMPKTDRVLSVIALVAVFNTVLLPVIGIAEAFRAMPGVTSLLLLYVLGISIWRWAKGDRIAGYFVLAWSLTLLSMLALVMQRSGAVSLTLMTDQMLQAITVFEVLLFGFALGARVSELRKQKELAQAEALENLEKVNALKDEFVEKLEQQVEQRTREIEQANEELRMLTEKVQKDSAIIGSLFESSVAIHQMEDVDELLDRSLGQLHGIFNDHRFGIVIHDEARGAVMYRSLRRLNPDEQSIIVNDADWPTDKYGDLLIKALNRHTEQVANGRAVVGATWQCLDIASRNQKLRGKIILYGPVLKQSQIEVIQVFANQISTAVENRTLSFELRKLANIDPLTGVGSRVVFSQVLQQLVYNATSVPKIDFAVVQVDLNGLKRVNDQCGHEAGDLYLVESARLLLRCCRERDIVVRQGGDEFVILCPNTDREGVEVLGDRIRVRAEQAVLDYRSRDGKYELRQPLSLAVGVASSSEVAPENVLRVADERMYRDKKDFYAAHPEAAGSTRTKMSS